MGCTAPAVLHTDPRGERDTSSQTPPLGASILMLLARGPSSI